MLPRQTKHTLGKSTGTAAESRGSAPCLLTSVSTPLKWGETLAVFLRVGGGRSDENTRTPGSVSLVEKELAGFLSPSFVGKSRGTLSVPSARVKDFPNECAETPCSPKQARLDTNPEGGVRGCEPRFPYPGWKDAWTLHGPLHLPTTAPHSLIPSSHSLDSVVHYCDQPLAPPSLHCVPSGAQIQLALPSAPTGAAGRGWEQSHTREAGAPAGLCLPISSGR